jgi:hypothetical protein
MRARTQYSAFAPPRARALPPARVLMYDGSIIEIDSLTSHLGAA